MPFGAMASSMVRTMESLPGSQPAENDVVVVSDFVNPTQFNDKNDLAKYPRTLDADCELLEKVGAAFARMNADPHVMEFFLHPLTPEESLAFYHRIQNEFQTCGFGLYAVERKEDHAFMGYTGLHQITFDVDFAPGIEIGWRLAHEYWGRGYAPEAATACLEYARESLDIKELFSFTSLPNQRSERVMQKIGMERVREFGHPLVPAEYPLHRHVLYHIDLRKHSS